MTSFQEFLQKQAKTQRQPSWRETREEWVQAVGRLIDQVTQWLAESDPDHLLEVIRYDLRMLELGLGPYEAPALQVSLGDLKVKIVPVARNVLGSPRTPGEGTRLAGRVDITNTIEKSLLMRVVTDQGEFWEVLDENRGATRFDKNRLEAILQDLLT